MRLQRRCSAGRTSSTRDSIIRRYCSTGSLPLRKGLVDERTRGDLAWIGRGMFAAGDRTASEASALEYQPRGASTWRRRVLPGTASRLASLEASAATKAVCIRWQRATAPGGAHKLLIDWSPQQISAWLEIAYPDDETVRVSRETIYQSLFIQARGALSVSSATAATLANRPAHAQTGDPDRRLALRLAEKICARR